VIAAWERMKGRTIAMLCLPYDFGTGGATRPLPRDGGVDKLHGDPTVGPRPKVWTRGQKQKK